MATATYPEFSDWLDSDEWDGDDLYRVFFRTLGLRIGDSRCSNGSHKPYPAVPAVPAIAAAAARRQHGPAQWHAGFFLKLSPV
jgi:hypothetical protein